MCVCVCVCVCMCEYVCACRLCHIPFDWVQLPYCTHLSLTSGDTGFTVVLGLRSETSASVHKCHCKGWPVTNGSAAGWPPRASKGRGSPRNVM